MAERRALERYPRPSVAVDAAVLTLDASGRSLLVLEVRRAESPGWALPGTFLHEGETLADAVRRALLDKAGVEGLAPRQLHVFDAPGRDDRGWVLSVAHVAVVRPEHLEGAFRDRTRLTPVDRPGRLPWDHADIIGLAVDDLRERYREKADPDGLLGDTFTLSELRHAHEAVSGRRILRDAFARGMLRRELIESTGEAAEGGRGRPAEMFRRT
ncbi:NUDIX hydrolase [Mycolicibacterium sediminis]|uniref:NUDIX hydrolase n=1 Tax=Mycolicibacterium sediminis TaxID=1286180 RepID=A0A7I7QZS2_9MYCO|nr:NUDIX domain-containing protein [Mycolicibacterium sediminis]BBY31851.1 NUDIX hydrolase [Mycolicibacterium sediminis]